MNDQLPAAQQLIDAVSGWRADRPDPLVVAIDGHGAAGKSVLATVAGQLLSAAVVHADDFFREARTAAGESESPMAVYYDWQRLRREALEPLRGGERGSWRAFDWETNGYLPGLVSVEPAAVVLVEGVSSTADALIDLIDRSVLVVTPESERARRLHDRIEDEAWDDSWLAAERAYFAQRPAGRFDLVVSGSAAASA
jgi:uridine kinase